MHSEGSGERHLRNVVGLRVCFDVAAAVPESSCALIILDDNHGNSTLPSTTCRQCSQQAQSTHDEQGPHRRTMKKQARELIFNTSIARLTECLVDIVQTLTMMYAVMPTLMNMKTRQMIASGIDSAWKSPARRRHGQNCQGIYVSVCCIYCWQRCSVGT